MARGSKKVIVKSGSGINDLVILRQEFNKLLTEFDALCTKLNADAGVADTDYGATPSAQKVV